MENKVKTIQMLNINALERYKKYASSYYDNNSAKSRLSAIKKFIDFLNKNENDISQIDHSSIEVFLTEEFDSELSVITVENDYSYLKGFLIKTYLIKKFFIYPCLL